MIEIDGSKKSGSGTILRLSIALSAIKQQPLHIINIRQKRPQPGLKHQHLEAVLTAAKLCTAKVEGATLGSSELWFVPNKISGGDFEAVIETAGSIPMLLMAVLPMCLFAKKPVHLHVAKGGTDTIHAPTINYLRNVLLPTLKLMGVRAEINVQKYGYYPKGAGEATMIVEPNINLRPIVLNRFGKVQRIKGISICTFLAERKVASRQAKAALDYLVQRGYTGEIQVENDHSNTIQKGSSITLWAQTDTGAIVGSDAIGERQKISEDVGKEAAQKLLTEILSQPTIDIHLADMLIPYMALSSGNSTILARTISEHIESNVWLIEKILNVKFIVKKTDNLFRIEKNS